MFIHLVLIPIYLAIRIKQNVVTPRVRAHESYLLRRELELEFNINNKFYTEKIYLFSLFRRRQGIHSNELIMMSTVLFTSSTTCSQWELLIIFLSLFLSIQWNKSLFHSDWSWFQSLTDNILLCILLDFWWSSRTIFLWFKRQIDIIMWIILFDTFEISLWSIPMAISTSYSECFTLDHSYCVDCYSARGSQNKNVFTNIR